MNFNALEKEIFRIGCEIAAGLMEQVLTAIDNHLAKNNFKRNPSSPYALMQM
jgi:hypothetical protein